MEANQEEEEERSRGGWGVFTRGGGQTDLGRGMQTLVVDIALLIRKAEAMLALYMQEVVEIHARIMLVLCLQQMIMCNGYISHTPAHGRSTHTSRIS